jgi:hypothetical protein
MLIALLAVLGVDLIVLVALPRSSSRVSVGSSATPAHFAESSGVASGEVDGLRPKWSRGYGRWVRDILVWTKAPFLFRNELVPGCPSRPGTDMGH